MPLQNTEVYLDGIFIHTETMEEHLEELMKLIDIIGKH